MSEPELKNYLHKLIDQQTDVSLLVAVQDFLTHSHIQSEGKMWKELTHAERDRVLKSFDESESDDNLIPVTKLFVR